ncbi:MAG: hypothetical protein AABY15_05265 [Nanoarchaeota archaeon]
MNIEKIKLEKIIKESKSKSEVCKKIGFNNNGHAFKKLDELIVKYNLDISNFPISKNHHVKYSGITKICPVCKNEFETKSGHIKEKETCSRACANTYFRSGENHPNFKDISKYGEGDFRKHAFSKKYREICFKNHEHKCVVCDESKILDVHHYDENKENNNPENLIPICPTHHMYIHSEYKDMIYDKVVRYRELFLKNIK